MKTFYLYWNYGMKEKIWGLDITDAIYRAGYGSLSLPRLDCYSENDDYVWNEMLKKWDAKRNDIVKRILL